MNFKRWFFRNKELLILSIIFIVIYTFSLTQFPRLWLDEAYFSNPAYELITIGKLGTTMSYGFYDVANCTYWQPPAYFLMLAASFKIFGFGLEQGRMVSVLLGLITVIFTYLLSKELYGKKVGVIASLFLISSPLFFLVSRTIRMDIAVACFTLIAVFFIVLAFKKSNPLYYFFSGIFAVLSLLSHWNGLISVVIVFLIIFIFKFDYKNMKLKLKLNEASYFITGLIIPLIPYLIYISINFNNFLGQFLTNTQSTSILSNIISETARYVVLSQKLSIYFAGFSIALLFILISALLIFLAIYFVFKNREFNGKLLLLVLITQIFLLATIVSRKDSYWYFGMLLPFWSILIASTFKFINLKSKKYSFKSILAILIVFGYISLSFYGIYHVYSLDRGYNYTEIAPEIQKYIPQGSAVVGAGDFWMVLNDNYTYYDFRRFTPSAVKELNIDYILYDSSWENEDLTNFKTFLNQNCTMIGVIQNPKDLSPIKIYKVNK